MPTRIGRITSGAQIRRKKSNDAELIHGALSIRARIPKEPTPVSLMLDIPAPVSSAIFGEEAPAIRYPQISAVLVPTRIAHDRRAGRVASSVRSAAAEIQETTATACGATILAPTPHRESRRSRAP